MDNRVSRKLVFLVLKPIAFIWMKFIFLLTLNQMTFVNAAAHATVRREI